MNSPTLLRPDPTEFPVRCARCSRSHTPASWAGLHPEEGPGLDEQGRQTYQGQSLEVRKCQCSGSLMVRLLSVEERAESVRETLLKAEVAILKAKLARAEERAQKAEAALRAEYEGAELEVRCVDCDQRLLKHQGRTWCERCATGRKP